MTKGTLVARGPGPELLRAAIARCGISMTDLADKLGVTRQHISVLCRGDTVPSCDLAVSLHELLDIPPRAWVRKTLGPRFKLLDGATPARASA